MFLLQAWTLLSNATTNSTVMLSGKGQLKGADVCNDIHTFNSEACHVEATGLNKYQLRSKAFHDWRDVVPGPECTRKYFIFGYDEFEFFWPEMTNCSVSTYAAMASATLLLDTPCRTKVKEEADILVIPPYLATDCHWPAPHEGCYGPTNELRAGGACEVMSVTTALNIQADSGKPVLLLDKDFELPDQVYQVLGHSSLIFAKVGTRMTHFRHGFDVSMPPAAHTTAYEASPEAFNEPASAKRYFAVFKGNLSSAAGRLVQDVLSGRGDSLALEDTQPFPDPDVFSKTRFVLMADPESYHFVEAVCSGGVPVMVGEEWSPPFDEFVPYTSYGMYLPPVKETILAALEGLEESHMDGMRLAAQNACIQYFQSTELQVQMLIQGILGRDGDLNSTVDKIDGRHYQYQDNEHMNPVKQ